MRGRRVNDRMSEIRSPLGHWEGFVLRLEPGWTCRPSLPDDLTNAPPNSLPNSSVWKSVGLPSYITGRVRAGRMSLLQLHPRPAEDNPLQPPGGTIPPHFKNPLLEPCWAPPKIRIKATRTSRMQIITSPALPVVVFRAAIPQPSASNSSITEITQQPKAVPMPKV